jgi:hypothetical protein
LVVNRIQELSRRGRENHLDARIERLIHHYRATVYRFGAYELQLGTSGLRHSVEHLRFVGQLFLFTHARLGASVYDVRHPDILGWLAAWRLDSGQNRLRRPPRGLEVISDSSPLPRDGPSRAVVAGRLDLCDWVDRSRISAKQGPDQAPERDEEEWNAARLSRGDRV